MKFTVTIESNNAAFSDDAALEVLNILDTGSGLTLRTNTQKRRLVNGISGLKIVQNSALTPRQPDTLIAHKSGNRLFSPPAGSLRLNRHADHSLAVFFCLLISTNLVVI